MILWEAREPRSRGRSGEIPEPTVRVRMKEERFLRTVSFLVDQSQHIADPFMNRAYCLALLGAGATSPNPMVGCVLVRDGQVVGEGYHAAAGSPHAEAIALAQAGSRAKGATAYVTLEPCAHVGRTPSCAAALVAAGVTAVVIGMPDPNPVAAGGASVLAASDIAVSFADDPTPFQSLNEEWLHHLAHGRPFVRVKVALSLDGKLTSVLGTRCAITAEGGRQITMSLRATADAVMVGAATAQIDDPALTVRDADGALFERQPVRVILGRRDVPRVTLLEDGVGPVSVLLERTAPDPHLPAHVRLLRYPDGGGVKSAIEALGEAGIRNLLVEAGPRLFSSLWNADMIDELVVIQAGGVLGPSAPSLFNGEGAAESNRLQSRMKPVESGVLLEDVVTLWRPCVVGPNEG